MTVGNKRPRALTAVGVGYVTRISSLLLEAGGWPDYVAKGRFQQQGGANAPAYWAPASLIRPTPKKTPVA